MEKKEFVQAENQPKKTGAVSEALTGLRKVSDLFETDLQQGDVVYPFTELVAGSIQPEFMVVTKDENGNPPYYEVPKDSVSWE